MVAHVLTSAGSEPHPAVCVAGHRFHGHLYRLFRAGRFSAPNAVGAVKCPNCLVSGQRSHCGGNAVDSLLRQLYAARARHCAHGAQCVDRFALLVRGGKHLHIAFALAESKVSFSRLDRFLTQEELQPREMLEAPAKADGPAGDAKQAESKSDSTKPLTVRIDKADFGYGLCNSLCLASLLMHVLSAGGIRSCRCARCRTSASLSRRAGDRLSLRGAPAPMRGC